MRIVKVPTRGVDDARDPHHSPHVTTIRYKRISCMRETKQNGYERVILGCGFWLKPLQYSPCTPQPSRSRAIIKGPSFLVRPLDKPKAFLMKVLSRLWLQLLHAREIAPRVHPR